jgi:hypothetical protein
VRVVDAEDPHAACDPELDDLQQRLPQRAPVRAVEVDVVDVLVALRRVLRVLQRAVGAVVEPLGVLAQPGVVGRALDREVERELDPGVRRRRDQPVEVLERAELRVDAVWPPSASRSPRDCPGRPAGDERVVATLAVGVPDRVDRRQVDHVEAELGEPRELLGDAGQAAEGAREELIPGAEAGAQAVHVDLDRRRHQRRARAVRVTGAGERRAPARAPARGAPPAGSADRRARPPPPRSARGRRRGREPRARASSAAPSSSSAERSRCPAAILRSSSFRQLASASIQPSTVHSQRPCASTPKEPDQRSPPRSASLGCIGASRHSRSPGPRERTTARSRSCPSAKIVALTSTRSPTHALTAWRPQSSSG